MEPLDHVSYSHLNLSSCPYAAFLRYEAGIKGPSNVYLALGNALHTVLEHALKDQDFNLQGWVSQFQSEYYAIIDQEEIFVPYPQLKRQETAGISMLEVYHGQIESGQITKRPLDVEKEFSIPVFNTHIVGRMDRTDSEDGGSVTDYKSGSAKPDPWFLRNDLQLTTYYWAYYEAYGFYPRKLYWHHLRTGELLETERTPKDIDYLKQRIENLLEMRERGIRYRVLNKALCGDGSGKGISCDYRGDSLCGNHDLEQDILTKLRLEGREKYWGMPNPDAAVEHIQEEY